MQIHRKQQCRTLSVAFVSALVLSACGGKSDQPAAAAPPPPPEVSVVTVSTESVPMVLELPGRTAPFMIAELRPQAGGLTQQRRFREGRDSNSRTRLQD